MGSSVLLQQGSATQVSATKIHPEDHPADSGQTIFQSCSDISERTDKAVQSELKGSTKAVTPKTLQVFSYICPESNG
jgi:hypothetical protein